MGLFVGCSLLTIVEFVDLILLICLRKRLMGQRNRVVKAQECQA